MGKLLLVTEPISARLQDLYAQWLVLQSNGHTILNQPDFNLDLLPTLPQDQALVRQHVIDYQQTVSKALLGGFQSFVTMGNQVGNFGEQLLPLAKQLDQSNPSDPGYDGIRAAFDALLSELERTTTSADPNGNSTLLQVEAVKDRLDTYYNEKAEDDTVRFETDVKEAKYSGSIAELQSTIGSIQGQIGDLNSAMASGATSEILTALKFGLAFGMATASSLAAPLIVVNMGLQIAGEIKSGTDFAKKWEQQNSQLNSLIGQYADLVTKLESAEAQLAVLLTVAGQVSTFGQSIEGGRDALDPITDQLKELSDGFGEMETMDAPTSPTFFEDQISGAVKFWGKVGSDCGRLLETSRTLQVGNSRSSAAATAGDQRS